MESGGGGGVKWGVLVGVVSLFVGIGKGERFVWFCYRRIKRV